MNPKTSSDPIPSHTESILGHLHPKGNLPTKHTLEIRRIQEQVLPFYDKRDFEEQERGFIAAPNYKKIIAEDGRVVWDIGKYDFLLEGKDFDSINPSLQRQALLNMNYGLYEVIPGIYQVRGFDLANITFIKGESGWIVCDPLTAKETAKAALEFINEKMGRRQVKAIIYSHSHADHFGGVRGVVDENEVSRGEVQIIAPNGFMENAILENVFVGNAMSRRMYFQYGVLIPASPFGHVDQAIGKNTAAGNVGLIPPTRVITETIDEITIDGVHIIFQNTPGTEAPAEMNAWFPDHKAFWAVENISGSIHNIYTLRGAKTRDALTWSKYINEALYRFGQMAEVMFSSHNWPRWGNARIQEVMRGHRDIYSHLNNQVLHLANQGVTINEIQNVYEMPRSLQREWYAHSYHGSVEHNSRAVINYYLGYWDANPVNLSPLSPKESAPLYVEMMGGSKRIIAKSKKLYKQGKYRFSQEILNKLIYAEPENQVAKDLLADVFEQLGYQCESSSLRNCYLAAAMELRDGIKEGMKPHRGGPDILKAMSTDMFIDFIAIHVDARKAERMQFKINLITPDNRENFLIEMSNETMTHIKGYLCRDPDLSIVINRSDLEQIMTERISFDQLVMLGKAKLIGNQEILKLLRSTLVSFDPLFEMLPGTKNVSSEKTF
jgi:alkyl sulfatase BDS1-like metallo-beta-lactamase superfamily hydrolase